MSNKDRHDIKLETDRLILRKPAPADADRTARLIDHYDIANNLGRVPHPYHLKDAETFLAGVDGNWGLDQYTFAVCLKEDNDQLIGMGGPFNFQSGRVELGYWLGKPYWGSGLMSEAVRALVEFVFDRVKAPFLLADHFIDNPASGRVLEKCGFREIEKRALYSYARGAFAPARFLRIDREDWRNKRILDAT
ncbi:MAG: GNAT family N-acetyltransferase [Fimbriimonadaceae bacterium]|nr:GNAT family N-acetyltransferase [Alphaproteobacteria bacterium]